MMSGSRRLPSYGTFLPQMRCSPHTYPLPDEKTMSVPQASVSRAVEDPRHGLVDGERLSSASTSLLVRVDQKFSIGSRRWSHFACR
jgi:hypothetical protein